MAHSNAEKREAEEADVRAALAALGIADADLAAGGDPPDFVLRLGANSVPLEHTRLYLEDSCSSPQARARLWHRLKARIHDAMLPVELDLEFALNDGWPHIPPTALHSRFTAALVALAGAGSAPFEASTLSLPPELSPFLLRVVGRPSPLPGEVCSTADPMYLSVPSFEAIRQRIASKVARLQGRVSGAWLIIVLGADASQPILGVGELEAELDSIALEDSPLERVYVMDISFRRGYVLHHGAWSRAV